MPARQSTKLPVRPSFSVPITTNTAEVARHLGWSLNYVQELCRNYRYRIEGLRAKGHEPTSAELEPAWNEIACEWRRSESTRPASKRIAYHIPAWAEERRREQGLPRERAARQGADELTVQEAAEKLGVKRPMIFYWMDRGQLRWRKAGKWRFVDGADVRNLEQLRAGASAAIDSRAS